MALGTVLTLGSMLAGLIGKGVSSYKNRKYEEELQQKAKEQQELTEKQRLRSAMARALGVDVEPYRSSTVEIPDRPSTTWSDILSGLGSAGSQIGSMEMAKQLYPTGTGSRSKYIDWGKDSGYGAA